MSTPHNPIDSFIHITDLHFWELVLNPFRMMNKRFIGNVNIFLKRRHDFAMGNADIFADHVASLGIKNVLVTGDFASTSTPLEFHRGKEWLEGLERRGLTPTVIRGNHDVYTFESVRKKRFESFYEPWLVNEKQPSTTTLPGDTKIHWISTVCANWFTSRGQVTPADVDKLVETFGAVDGPVLVAGHYPILENAPGYVVNHNRGLQNAEMLRKALGKSGKEILYLHGHVHRFNYSRDPDYPNLKHLSTGAFFRIAEETNSHGEFSEVHVHSDYVQIVRHRIDSNGWNSEEMSL